VPPKRRKHPVLQRYQVEIRGTQYFVMDTKRHAIVAGPFRGRIKAQEHADQLEKRRPSG
jgi:hypothetical protein